jgi:hydroxymethylglutaryl-CoA lyase
LGGSVSIVEVGPRDGLQNEAAALPVDVRVGFIRRLVDAGLRRIEVGSFVSPQRVPQMAGTADVAHQLPQEAGLTYSVLSASETFSRRNINCSIDESLARFLPVMRLAAERNIPVRGYVSCVLGCPYEGNVPLTSVVAVSKKLAALGCREISLGDTIGIGTPRDARAMVRAVASQVPIKALAVHFHDTRGQALANIAACLDEGVAVIDSAVAGLGGCPYAPGASGNVATEDLLYMLNGMGIDTGVDLAAVVQAGAFISTQLDRTTQSKVARTMLAA